MRLPRVFLQKGWTSSGFDVLTGIWTTSVFLPLTQWITLATLRSMCSEMCCAARRQRNRYTSWLDFYIRLRTMNHFGKLGGNRTTIRFAGWKQFPFAWPLNGSLLAFQN